jgi:hypothetical protein
VKSLEENLTTMRSDLSGLAAQMTRRSPPGEGRLEPCHEPLADLAGSEDPIDAMGAVTFADEEDCGYFGEGDSSPIRSTLQLTGNCYRPILEHRLSTAPVPRSIAPRKQPK